MKLLYVRMMCFECFEGPVFSKLFFVLLFKSKPRPLDGCPDVTFLC